MEPPTSNVETSCTERCTAQEPKEPPPTQDEEEEEKEEEGVAIEPATCTTEEEAVISPPAVEPPATAEELSSVDSEHSYEPDFHAPNGKSTHGIQPHTRFNLTDAVFHLH